MSRLRAALLLTVAAAGFFGGGWILRQGLSGRTPSVTAASDQPPTIGSRLFQDVLRHVRSYAVDSLDEMALYQLAATGMLDELDDPYAAIVAAHEQGAGRPPLGLYLDRLAGAVVVVAVVSGSPGALAGIHGGDFIVDVDGKTVEGLRPHQVARLLTGPAGSEVRIRLARPGSPSLRVAVTRDSVPEPAAPALESLGDGVARITLHTIDGSAAERVSGLVESALADGTRGLILDLRGVVEGGAEEAAAVAGLFLSRDAVVMTRRGRPSGDSAVVRTASASRFPDVPLAVLVDRGTAGPAEVVAGALQDHDRALIVGEPTFGRGVDLTYYPLRADSALRLATAHWYTPAGRPIQREPPAEEDSDADEADRPEYRTDAGRKVLGGGGIVPDREVTRPAAERGEDPIVAIARALVARARSTSMLLSLESKGRG